MKSAVIKPGGIHTSPVNGATYSIVEPVVFDIDPPYASGTGAWTPTEYRVTFYNQLQQKIGTPITSPTGQITVQPSEIGGATGPVSACVQARDGNLELANGPQLWTNCEWTNIVRTGVQLGVNPQGQSFAGVDAATGNYYTPFVDFNPTGVADGFSLVRHVNSLDDTAGIFGPGISTAFEGRSAIYPPIGTTCSSNPTSGDCTMSIIKDDGSRMLFEWDAPANKWVDIAGGPTTAVIDSTGSLPDFVVTYKDGSTRRYDYFGLGEITEMVSPEGHKLTVVLDPNKHYHPTTIRDEESGRTINLNYTDLDPHPNKELWLVTSATVNDGTQTLTWNYSYQNGFLTTTTDPRGFVTNYTWIDHDTDPNTPNRLDTITWPANGRLTNLDYDVQGRVTQVTDGEANTTDLTYPTSSQTTVVDANNKTWTVDYDAQARVTKLTDPGTTSTQYEYEGAYRDKVIDATGLEANLAYDDDGNLTSRTNAANETTYYRYDTTGGYYGNNDIITGPSHVCDARSSGPTDSTYCTISKYDSYGNLIYRAAPGETAAEAEEWVYTTGSEGAVGGGTMPAGLLKQYRDGNTTAQGGEGTTTFAYDSKGDLRQRTDAAGLFTEWTHDLLGRQTTEKATYTDNGVSKTVTLSTTTYDKNSNIKTETGPLVTNTLAGSHQLRTTFVYDQNSNVLSRTMDDIAGTDATRLWTYTYDSLDRELSSFDPEGHSIVRQFDGNGNVTAVTDARLNRVETSYDSRNNPTLVTAISFDDGHGTTANRIVSDPIYDSAGRLKELKTYTATGTFTHEKYSYDGADRPNTTQRLIDGAFVTVEDNNYVNGFLQSVTIGNTAATAAQDKSTTTFVYNVDGTISQSVTDGRTTDFLYDDADNPTSIIVSGTDPVSSTTTTTDTRTVFDSAGNAVRVTVENWAQDLISTFTFDERGLVTGLVGPRGNETGATAADFEVTSDYDVLGRAISVTSPAVNVESASNPNSIAASWSTNSSSPTVDTGYDTFGNLSHLRNELGETTITAYDRNDRSTRVTHPTYVHPTSGATTPYETWAYDANGNVSQYRTRLGNITDYAFDDANRVTTQTDPAIPQTANPNVLQARGVNQSFYDWAGRVTKTINAEGAVTQIVYDDRGQVETQTVTIRAVGGQPAQSAITTFAYSALGYATNVIGPEGVVSSTTFDAFGSPLTTSTGGLDSTTFVYDGVGRIRKVTNPNGAVVTTSYDTAGRPTSVTETGSDLVDYRTTYTTYNADDTIETTTSERGGVTTYSYDNLNRLTTVDLTIDASNDITYSYGYDEAGNTTRVTDGDQLVTRYVFNEWGLMSHTLEPKATAGSSEPEADRVFKVGYNNGGQANYESSPGNQILIRDYNQLALPTTETITQTGQATVSREWSYTRLGQVAQTSHPTTPTVFTYDDRGLLVTQTGGAGTASFTYDKTGRTLSRDDDAGDNTFTYNPTTGLTETVTNSAGGGGGGGGTGGPYDILLLVSNPASLQATETRIKDHLTAEGHTVTLRDAGSSEITVTDDLLIIADAGGLGNKYKTQAIPTVLLEVGAWSQHGLITSGKLTYGWGSQMVITDPAHDLAAGLSGTQSFLASASGMAYANASGGSPFGTATPDLVADMTTTTEHTIFGYDNGQTMASGTAAPERRVGLSGMHASNATPAAAGWSLLDAALDWASGNTSGGGGGTGAWDIAYSYDSAGRSDVTTYGDGGTQTYTYDALGRLETDTLKDDSNATTASSAFTYSCDHELIAKDINLPGNTGSGLNTFTYDHAGRLTSWDDSATATPATCPTSSGGGGGGGTSGPLDVLLLVSDPASLEAVETSIKNHLTGEGHTVTLRDAGASEETSPGDLIIVADANGLGNKYETQAVPILELDPGSWVNHEMIKSGSTVSYVWGSQMSITDPGHDLAGGLTGTVTFLTSSKGIAHVTSAAFGSPSPVLVADDNTSGNIAYFGYESGDTLAGGTTVAPERRVVLSGLHNTNATPATDGWTMFDAAVDWSTGNTTSGGGGGSGWVESGEIYTYDNRGNRLTAGTDTFTYDGRNRLKTDPDGSYVWNSDGTLDTFTPSSGPAEVYSFDAGDRLTQITDGTNTTSYVYDAADRISSRDGTAFTYAGGELDPTSDGTDLFHRSPSGQLLAYESGASTSHPFSLGHHDLNGLFDSDGTLTDSRTYDPYGDPVDETGTTDPVLGFQSDYTDPDTEHVWMGARWYQPSSGTFLSRDTVFGELRTPFTLNRYTYAVNNPNRYWDPDGNRSIYFEDELNGAEQRKIEAKKAAAAASNNNSNVARTERRLSELAGPETVPAVRPVGDEYVESIVQNREVSGPPGPPPRTPFVIDGSSVAYFEIPRWEGRGATRINFFIANDEVCVVPKFKPTCGHGDDRGFVSGSDVGNTEIPSRVVITLDHENGRGAVVAYPTHGKDGPIPALDIDLYNRDKEEFAPLPPNYPNTLRLYPTLEDKPNAFAFDYLFVNSQTPEIVGGGLAPAINGAWLIEPGSGNEIDFSFTGAGFPSIEVIRDYWDGENWDSFVSVTRPQNSDNPIALSLTSSTFEWGG